jgi:TMC domain
LQKVACWESDLSLKFYQLVVMNLIFEWGLTIVAAAVICVQRAISKKQGWTTAFRADLLTQRIIYLQILTWFATYYSPMICGLTLFCTGLMVFREAVRYSQFLKKFAKLQRNHE